MKKSVKISKKTGIALFVTAAVIMALLIVFHKNPGPAVDQSQELAKKIISCVVIAAACFAFIHWYDKFTGLPVELSYQWINAKHAAAMTTQEMIFFASSWL